MAIRHAVEPVKDRGRSKNAATTGKAFGLRPCHPVISFFLATRPQETRRPGNREASIKTGLEKYIM